MGKFKDIFVTCLGLGMVAGAGYYLYRKYVSRNSEENSSASQSGADREAQDTNHEHISETSKTDGNIQDSMSNVTEPERTQMTKVLDDGPNHAAGKEPVVENAIQTSRKDEPEKLENPTNPQTQTKKKKSNFGGLKKGFLL